MKYYESLKTRWKRSALYFGRRVVGSVVTESHGSVYLRISGFLIYSGLRNQFTQQARAQLATKLYELRHKHYVSP